MTHEERAKWTSHSQQREQNKRYCFACGVNLYDHNDYLAGFNSHLKRAKNSKKLSSLKRRVSEDFELLCVICRKPTGIILPDLRLETLESADKQMVCGECERK
ncbi:hypothetical protein ACFL1B_05425 [Nanoarchaeota archaeon]